MVHWMILNFPVKESIFHAALIVACIFFPCESRVQRILMLLALLGCIVAFVSGLSIDYEKVTREYKTLKKIVLPEFIESRPFKESDLARKQETLENMLIHVNAKIIAELKTNYTFKSTDQLIEFHNAIISDFMTKYDKYYRHLPVEHIEDWDKVVLEARMMQQEDLDVCANKLPFDNSPI